MRIVIFPIMCHLPRGDKKNSLLKKNKQVLEKKELFLDIGRNEMLRCCKIRPIMLDGSFVVNIKTRIPRLERGSGLSTMVSSS